MTSKRIATFIVLLALAPMGLTLASNTPLPAASRAATAASDGAPANVNGQVGGCPGGCDDGDACTADSCFVDTCEHDGINCDDLDPCNGEETCNPSSGCQAGTPLSCDDGNACNGVEQCLSFFGCDSGFPPDCDDFDACNGQETCDSATGCVPGTPLNCDDGNACNGVETCFFFGCEPGFPPDCNDFDECTTDSCDPSSGCITAPVVCDDSNPCTDDSCDVGLGCTYTSNDPDSDGACLSDNCPEIANDDQADADGDGLGDVCDTCPTDADNDGDADGYCAPDDNCPAIANAEQADSDKDRRGDACDSCPFDSRNDGDFDGRCADQDNCAAVYNPGQEDDNKNGVGNACEPLRVNFAPQDSDPAEAFAPDFGLPFDPSRGWGWDATLATRERGQELPQELDTFVFTRDVRRWTAQLPNGDYDVHAYSGDALFAQGPHRVRANGASVIDDVPNATGQFVDGTARVAVRNGRLDVLLGGTNGYSMLNWIEATPLDHGQSFHRSVSFRAEAPAPAGFEPDYGSAFDDSTGYGWDGDHLGVTRHSSVPAVLDGYVAAFGQATWEIRVPAPGYYDVWLSVGDALAPIGYQRVTVEGTPVVLDESTAAGHFIERHTGAFVDDGMLTVQVGQSFRASSSLTPESLPTTTLNYVVVAEAEGDADGDFIDNADDVCPFVSDPDQTDSDEDGVGDACDSDRDDDGVENPSDVCPDVDDPDQDDTDQDGRGDACDACPEDPFNDVDDDGVCGLSDNCPEVANPDQDDLNADGRGDACSTLRVNFGPATSPTPEGFVPDAGSVFDWFRGRGWNAPLPSRDRGSAAPQELDTFVFSAQPRSWQAELPNGDYHVRTSIGDPAYAQGPERVVVQGTVVFSNRFMAKNEFAEGDLDVQVRNGRLQLQIGLPICTADFTPADPSLGGCIAPGAESLTSVPFSGYTTINWIEAVPLDSPSGYFRTFNFQPESSEVPDGVTVDSGSQFDKRGYGWNAPVPTRERGLQVPQVLDTFAFASFPHDWEVDLPNGVYHVYASVGDARFAQGPQRLVVEGNDLVNGESTSAGTFLERDTFVLVQDGRLTVQIGGAGGNTCLNYVTIESAPVDR